MRPSFVLSGAAMSVACNSGQLTSCLTDAEEVSADKPVVISKYHLNAKEIEFDAVSQDGNILNYAISEHIENAGVHSGDATLVLPAQKLYVQTVRKVKQIAQQISKALHISGPFNIQFLAKDNMIKVIECNLRASRSFPFISKTLDANFITLATKVMLRYPCKSYNISLIDYEYVSVKAPQFSFTRLRGADPTLGVEMSSTGEVACFGHDVHEAFLQAMLASTFKFPSTQNGRHILVSIAEESFRNEFYEAMRMLEGLGFHLAGTEGTADYFSDRGIVMKRLSKPPAEDEESVIRWIKTGKIDLVINIADGSTKRDEITAGYLMRRAAVDYGASLVTNVKCAIMLCEGLHRNFSLPCKSSEEFVSASVKI